MYLLIYLFDIGLLVIFLSLLIKRSLKMAVEKGLTPIFTTKCGGQIGSLGYSPPFIRLALYDDFIVISGFRKIQLKYEDINRLVLKSLYWYKGFEIWHANSSLPPDLSLSFFGTKDFEKTKNIIETKMCEIQQSKAWHRV